MDNFMPKKIDILLTGVGGQGVVLASDIIGDIALEAGYDVKKSDTLGMSQRGGSVVAHIRLGHEIASPTIPRGEVEYLLSFEKLETLRWADELKNNAIVVYNDQAIPPLSVNRGEAVYPTDEQIVLTLSEHTTDIFAVPGEAFAAGIGNPKVANIFMLGAFSMFMPFSPEVWKKAIAHRLPEKMHEINFQAFQAGRKELMRILGEIAIERENQALEEAHEHGHDESCGCG